VRNDITVVTSWSEKGGSTYGGKFIDGFRENWGEIPLWVITDDDVLQDPRVREFRKREEDPVTSKREDYHFGVMKWSWKVFALTAKAEDLPNDGWLIWIDGDVEFTAPITDEFLDTVCPNDHDVSFLDRPNAYASETGFVCYNLRSPSVRVLLHLMREVYLSGAFRDLKEWGDAAVFDHCRLQVNQSPDPLKENNLNRKEARDDLHCWPYSPLAPYMIHNKGHRLKSKAYGRTR